MPIENEDEILATTGVRPPRRRKELEAAPKTTGSFWGDVVEAVKLINVKEDFRDITEMPCARKSLMAAIASGAGIGVIRGVSVTPLVACNWAMGTFFVVAMSSWNICRMQRAGEKAQMDQIRRLTLEKRRALARRQAEEASASASS